MNKRIYELLAQARNQPVDIVERWPHGSAILTPTQLEKFAALIVEECDRLNKKNSFELLGVIVDTEEGAGFDSVCLDTVKRVEQYLFNNSLKEHFKE